MNKEEMARYEELLRENLALREKIHQLTEKPIPPEGDELMPFGKYRGVPYSRIPLSYARWLLETMRSQTLKIKRFGKGHDRAVGTRLMIHLMQEDYPARLDQEVRKELEKHKSKYKNFDDQKFSLWLDKRGREEKVRLLWLGVPFLNEVRKAGGYARWEKGNARKRSEEQAQNLAGEVVTREDGSRSFRGIPLLPNPPDQSEDPT